MSVTLATIVVRALYAYLLVGCAFAVGFVSSAVNRLDPVAAHGTRGFRALIFPGVVLLWPLLALRLLRRTPR